MSRILNQLQEKAFSAMASVPEIRSGFYFTGGTALSEFYLGHRESVDIDLFSEAPFNRSAAESAAAAVAAEGISVWDVRKIHDRYQFEISDGRNPRCHVDVCHYPFRRLERPGGHFMWIPVDSVRDIWANKWAALFDRNEPKDVLDIACLVRFWGFGADEASLRSACADVKAKFGLSLNPHSMVDQYRSRLVSTSAERTTGILHRNPWKLDVFAEYFPKFPL